MWICYVKEIVMTKEGMVRLLTRIPPQLRIEFRTAANSMGYTMEDLIAVLVEKTVLDWRQKELERLTALQEEKE
jgi:hypothetical protein